MKSSLFPKIKPYDEGFLKVSKIHTLHYEQVGNPKGKPAIFLHGGPGVGIIPEYRRLLDPKFYRIILLDQRGAGKSRPFAELRENTALHLVEDLEKLRNHLDIKKWLVTGGSWGSLLALLYAISYPRPVKGIIIRGVCLGRKKENDWLFKPGGASEIWPDEWEKFVSIIPKNNQDRILHHYYRLLTSKKTQTEAAKRWSNWEEAIMSIIPKKRKSSFLDSKKEISFAKTECHYALHNFFISPENLILNNADKIKNIPVYIIQGRYDTICPMSSAWDLHKALPKSKLVIVPLGSHTPFDEAMTSELIKAQEKFKKIW